MPALAHAPCSLSRVRRANSRTAFGRPRNRTKYGNAAHKHAVTAAGSQPFTYDANGNMITNTGNTIGWTSYNLPSSIASGSNSAVLNYNADHQRWKQDAT